MSNPEAVSDFVSSLNDLKTTNKANISMLTILAEDDKQFAPEITKVIENRLREAPPPEKLPVLYLIDSIIKNLPDTPYRQLFSENIVNNFVNVFAQVDDKVRGAMYKVRQTWCEIFSAKKLFVLDVKVNKIDPKWPIMPLPPDDISRQQQQQQQAHPPQLKQPAVVAAAVVPVQQPTPAPVVVETAVAPVTVPPPPLPSSAPSFTNESILAKEEELRRLREKHLEMQLQKQKLLVEKQQEELARIEQAKQLQEQLRLLVEQVKTAPLPESAQKLLLETVTSTLTLTQVASASKQQPVTSTTATSTTTTSTTGSGGGATASSGGPALPRDPRKRHLADQSSKEPAKNNDVLGQVVQNLQEFASSLKPSGGDSGDETGTNGRSKVAFGNDVTTMSPGGTKRVAKRQLEPKDTSLPAVKSAKSDLDEQAVADMTAAARLAMEEEEAGGSVSDAEFNAAVESFREISQVELPYPRKSALKQTTTVVASQPQPLEPVQPLKPPGSAMSLPPGPGPMPAMPTAEKGSSHIGMSENDQHRLLDEAERQLQTGQLTTAQHNDLVDRLTQLYDIQRRIKDVRSGQHPPPSQPTQPPPAAEPTAVVEPVVPLLPTAPSAPHFPPPPLPTSTEPHRPHQAPLLPTPPSAENKAQLLQPASFPSTAHVVLNGEPIDMTIGGPPRTIFVAGKRRVIRINAQSRQILMDGRPVYKLNSLLRETMVDGCRCMIFYHGEMQTLWINSVEYRIRVDAPPQTVIVDGQPIELVIDTGAGEILVNGERACAIANLPCEVSLPPNGNRYRFSYHAPARQIQIDNQFCEVKLDLPVPAVLINGELRGIRFDGPPRILLIDDEPFEIHTDRAISLPFGRDDPPLTVQLGAPAQELIIGDHRYNIGFGTGPVFLMVNNKKFKVELPGNTPEVKLLGLIDAVTGQLLSPPAMPPPPMPMPPMPMPPFGAPPFVGPPQMTMPPPMPPPPPGIAFPMFPPSQMAATHSQHSGSYAQPSPAPAVEPQIQHPPPPLPIGVPSVPTGGGSVDINDLISRLMNRGMLPVPTATPAVVPSKQQTDLKGGKAAEIIKETPDLTDFNMDLFKTKYQAEITRLYAGVQCGSCGCRFSSPESSRYRLHLDWHFRVNKREREAVRILRHRAWFLPVMDWISLEQSAEPDQSLGVNESSMMINVSGDTAASASTGPNQQRFVEATEPAGETGNDGRPGQLSLGDGSLLSKGGDEQSGMAGVVSCPAASDTKKDTCVVCGDTFETFWHEELDEWHLKDALCVSGKIYHTVCFEDAARTSVASTPSSPTFPPSTPLIGSNSVLKDNKDNSAEPTATGGESKPSNGETRGDKSPTPPPGALICPHHHDNVMEDQVKLEPVVVKMESTSDGDGGTGDETS